MPKKSSVLNTNKPYNEKSNAGEIVQSAENAIKQILQMEHVSIRHKKELLSVMIWKISEAHGKWNVRFLSRGVVEEENPKIQHEHVVTRKEVISKLLENPENYQQILKEVVACLVTTDEHELLSKTSNSSGWNRYKNCGVDVFDRKEEKWMW